MSVHIHHSDVIEWLVAQPDNHFDAMLTDPPAGISFMGAKWDSDKGGRKEWCAWLEGVMRECLRVLKPGAYAMVWSLPRTCHWTGTALEDAGFDVRDCVMHVFGSGFPKSFNISKKMSVYDEATWEGYGTALKPAYEAWWLVRKPLDGTIAANAMKYGVGGINVDGCRIGSIGATIEASVPIGRWPANFVMSHAYSCEGECVEGCPVSELNEQSGGASRFFYCAKPGRKEREAGCDELPLMSSSDAVGRDEDSAGINNPRAGANRTGGARNHHPTLKPINLATYFAEMLLPPARYSQPRRCLVPFAGSATECIGAHMAGFEEVHGIEREEPFVQIARARAEHWCKETQTSIPFEDAACSPSSK